MPTSEEIPATDHITKKVVYFSQRQRPIEKLIQLPHGSRKQLTPWEIELLTERRMELISNRWSKWQDIHNISRILDFN